MLMNIALYKKQNEKNNILATFADSDYVCSKPSHLVDVSFLVKNVPSGTLFIIHQNGKDKEYTTDTNTGAVVKEKMSFKEGEKINLDLTCNGGYCMIQIISKDYISIYKSAPNNISIEQKYK